MTAPLWYPGAERVPQPNNGSFTGGPAKGVLHSTESPGFGKWATFVPGTHSHLETLWVPSTKTMRVRQYYPFNQPARALKDGEASPVRTNRDSAFQIEIGGTCNPAHRNDPKWIYLPAAPEEYLVELRKLMIWLENNYGIKPVSPLTWAPYPKSYGTLSVARMSNARWDSYNGWCGHQHVPDNDHGDPGDLNIAFLLERPKPKPPKPDPEDDDMPKYVSLSTTKPITIPKGTAHSIKWDKEGSDIEGWHSDNPDKGGYSIAPDVRVRVSCVVGLEVEDFAGVKVDTIVLPAPDHEAASAVAKGTGQELSACPDTYAAQFSANADSWIRVRITAPPDRDIVIPAGASWVLMAWPY